MKNIILGLILMVATSATSPSTTSAGSVTGFPSTSSGAGSLNTGAGSVTASLMSTGIPPSTKASLAGGVQIAFEQTTIDNKVPDNFFLKNWGVLVVSLLGFFDVVVRLTPTTKDNSIVNLLATIINAIIPNFKKGGGSF